MSDEVLRVPLEQELDAHFAQYTAAGQARGLVYGLADAGGLSHSAGFGVVDDDGLVPDADTVFPIASMTKSFVTCAALIARDRGLVGLHERVTRYVPEFVLSGDAQDVPTLEMLFGMCGGLTEDNSWVDPFIDRPTDALLAEVSRGVRLSHRSGSVYEYSNLGFTMAGLALSRAVGRSLEEFVTDELLTPLGLTSTRFDSALPTGAARAVGYFLDEHGEWVAYAPQASDAFAAAGGLTSTVRDLARWITWLGTAFRDGTDDGVLSRSSRRDLQRLRIPLLPSLALAPTGAVAVGSGGYALGLFVRADAHRGTYIYHSGGLPGFRLYMTWHPASGHGAVVLTNSHRGDPISLCDEALGRAMARHEATAATITLWPETVALRKQADALVRRWDDVLARRIFADNVEFDRSLAQRRTEIEALVAEVGPLVDGVRTQIVSAASAADVTWSIPAERGELLCMIHVTPVEPAQVQELVVAAVPAGRARSAAPLDISPRRARMGEAYLSPLTNVRIAMPEEDRQAR